MSSLLKILVAFAFISFAAPSFGQATRTWVSGVGDDVNPCSRTAPCKTFAGAISKTAPNGEINCLDPGGFGAVTITKSITIDCTGTMGSILNSGTNGINVNDSATATPGTIEVLLRGISIDGGGSLAGINGIRMTSARSLVLQDVFIQNQNGGSGIALEPTAAARFFAENVTVSDGQRGILIAPSGANGSIRAILRNVRIQNNSNAGLRLDPTSTAAPGINVTVEESSISGNATGIGAAVGGGTQSTVVMVSHSVIANNTGAGIQASGALARLRVGNSTITGNQTGIQNTGAIVNTYGNNRLDGNNTDGTFTTPAIPQQ